MTLATDVLRDEHRVILRGLVLLESAADRVINGESLPDDWWDGFIGVLRAFADRSHHAKEERCLFPALVKAGIPAEGGPVAVMLAEHADGRDLIQAMWTVPPAYRADAARRYARLLRDHIDKENGVLFPLAEAVLEEHTLQSLALEFESVEAEQGRDASIEHAAAGLDRLEAVLGGGW
jgi:hemerythrin-like domain-containing protein